MISGNAFVTTVVIECLEQGGDIRMSAIIPETSGHNELRREEIQRHETGSAGDAMHFDDLI